MTGGDVAWLEPCVALLSDGLYPTMQDESSIAAHLGERAARPADAESVAVDDNDDAQSIQDDAIPGQSCPVLHFFVHSSIVSTAEMCPLCVKHCNAVFHSASM